MSKSSSTSRRRQEGYIADTCRPLPNLVFVLPLLLAFHAGTAYYGTRLLAPRDLGRLLKLFGATAAYLPALLIVAVLLVEQVFGRQAWKLHGTTLAGMVGESLLWVAPLVAISHVSGKLISNAAATAPAGADNALVRELLVAVGAGIYEEFLFRLVLISLALLVFVDVFELRRDAVAGVAVLVSAGIFSLYHFSGGEMTVERFEWGLFLFRMTAGVYLGVLFVYRGFGIAVGTHALYDVYVAISRT